MGADNAESRGATPAQSSRAPAKGQEKRPEKRPEKPVLPSVSRDETDVGWGDEPGERDADWYRRERPPHHE